MKIAHLILAHAQPEQLSRLVDKLTHDEANIYIHIDLKTDIAPFQLLTQKKNVFFIKKRVKVYWAGYSIVQATINGFEEILASGVAYGHINLLSGQDYPIKPIAHVHNYLKSNPGKIFMHFLNVEKEWQEAIPRITNYYFISYNLPAGTYRAEQLINKLLPKRKLPNGMVAMGRSQWFTLTPESAAYIVKYLRENPSVSRFFRLSWAPDELIFQTILYNSEFRDKMVNDNLLFVDWSRGAASPEVLNMDYADTLKRSDKLFARKFSPEADTRILDYLDTITA